MKYYTFNASSDERIRASVRKIDTDFYYGCASMELLTNVMLCSCEYERQKYQIIFRFQGYKDIIEYVVKADDSGDVDYIEIKQATHNNVDKVLDIVKQTDEFWGIKISKIETLGSFANNIYRFII